MHRGRGLGNWSPQARLVQPGAKGNAEDRERSKARRYHWRELTGRLVYNFRVIRGPRVSIMERPFARCLIKFYNWLTLARQKFSNSWLRQRSRRWSSWIALDPVRLRFFLSIFLILLIIPHVKMLTICLIDNVCIEYNRQVTGYRVHICWTSPLNWLHLQRTVFRFVYSTNFEVKLISQSEVSR